MNRLRSLGFKATAFLAIIAFIVFIGWLLGWWFDSDLGKFPFESSVWGTFSDYLVLSMTAISLVFIYFTFESQIEAIKHQNRQQRLTEMKIRKSFICNLIVSKEPNNDGESELIRITNNGDKLNDLDIDIIGKATIFDPQYQKFSDVENYKYPFTIQLKNGCSTNINVKEIVTPLTFRMQFHDDFGFKYQKSFIIFNSGKVEQYDLKYLRE